MASTSATEIAFHSGYETVPGIKVGAYGSAYVNMKTYTFTATSTVAITATSTEVSYTVNGLTTNDFPMSLVFSTGIAGGTPGIGNVRVSAANTLGVSYSQNGTSTVGFIGPASAAVTTIQIISLASSTTT